MNTAMTDRLLTALPAHAVRVLNVLENTGFEAWVVGGYVRDVMLDRPVHDIDIATNAHWQQVKETCEQAGMHTFETGVAHGTLSVLPAADADIIEVTTFRTEGSYRDARHPDTVSFVNTIEEDLARRDFTMNAIAFHPARGLCDPYGGTADIQAGIIRAVGEPKERFGEDALRILRAVRFASELGFALDLQTLTGANDQVERLNQISVERIATEISRLLCGPQVRSVLMDYPVILDTVLPELTPMRGLDQKSPYHIYDVMEHTARVVEGTEPNLLLRWAALLHDIGKPASLSIGTNGQGHFYSHAKVSAEMTAQIMKRLKMPTQLSHDVELLVRFHDTHRPANHKMVKRMLRQLEGRPELLRALCHLQVADANAHAPEFTQRAALSQSFEACLDEVLAAQEAFTLGDLAITGSDVMALGVDAGPQVGNLLNAALDAVINEEVPNERAALLEFMRAQGL